jgi:hypothetical protein
MKMHALRVFPTRLRLFTVALLASAFAVGFAKGVSSAASFDAVDAAAPTRLALLVTRTADRSSLEVDAWREAEVGNVSRNVLRLALGAARCAIASGDVRNPETLTIIDYSKPSVEPRMWVFDLTSRTLLYEELVSHGQGSGGNFATRFSNEPESHQTSIGLFVTDTAYMGRNGYSLRLDGLDRGFNDRARERAIVMHGAPYVNPSITKSLGRLGRSHGCPAVRTAVARELIDRVKGGDLVFSYYPNEDWLEQSKYLGNCGN